MKAKELVGAALVGVSTIAAGCVITTERPADSSPPPTPPPPAPAVASVAPAPPPEPVPDPAPTADAPADAPDATPPVATETVDAGGADAEIAPAPPAAPKKTGIKGRKPDPAAPDGGI